MSTRSPFQGPGKLFDPRRLEELADRVQAALPRDVANLGEDVRKNVQATVEAGLKRMDIVTREEFDVQAAVLARTRELVEQLEARVAELEKDRSA